MRNGKKIIDTSRASQPKKAHPKSSSLTANISSPSKAASREAECPRQLGQPEESERQTNDDACESPKKPLIPITAAALIRPEGRSSDIIGFETEVVKFFVQAAEILGVPRSLALIYSVFFASPRPLSFGDLNRRLEISQGSISQGIRLLCEVGAIRVSHVEERREHFTPDLELRKLAVRFIEKRLDRQISTSRIALTAIGEHLPCGQGASSLLLKERLKSLQSWHEKTRALLPIVKLYLRHA